MLSQHKLSAKKLGFTLIEMMFVILILSFIIVQIARTQQARVQQRTIEHAATDMLNWEVAIVNYYLFMQKWPTTKTTPTSLSITIPARPSATTPADMPPSAVCSPFVTDTSNSGPPCYGREPYSGSIPLGSTDPANSLFYLLSVKVNSSNMAKLLAAKLPNAYVDNSSSGIVVYMAIPIPSQTQQSQYRGWLVSAGVVSTTSGTGNWPADIDAQKSNTNYNRGPPGSSVYLPNCPTGFEGHMILSPLEYETNDYNWGTHITMVNPAANGTYIGNCNKYQQNCLGVGTSGENGGTTPFINYDSNNNPYVIVADNPDLKTKEDQNGNDYDDTSTSIRHLATFLTFCLPLTTDSGGYYNTYPSKWYTSGLDANFPQDGECSSSWIKYFAAYGDANPNCSTNMIISPNYIGNPDAY